MKPTRYGRDIRGEAYPEDEAVAVRCPSCKNEILTYDELDITGEFLS
jgi:ribosomal protein S27E